MVNISRLDVLKIIVDYLKQNGHSEAAKLICEQEKEPIDIFDDFEVFIENVKQRKWTAVLETVSGLYLKPMYLVELFSLCFLDLVFKGEIEAARVILKSAQPMKYLRVHDPPLYAHYDSLLMDQTLTSQEQIESEIQSLQETVVSFFKSRFSKKANSALLLDVINDSLKWRFHSNEPDMNVDYDLVEQRIVRHDSSFLSSNSSFSHVIELPKIVRICAHPTDPLIACCDKDGFIHLFDPRTGAKHSDYVNSDPIAMPSDISCVRFSCDGKFLMAGSVDGNVAIWRLENGNIRAFRFFPKIGEGQVLSVDMDDHSNVLVCIQSKLCVVGMVSGSILRSSRGIQQAFFDGSRIVAFSCSSISFLDGNLNIILAVSCPDTIHRMYLTRKNTIFADHYRLDTKSNIFTSIEQASDPIDIEETGDHILCIENQCILIYKKSGVDLKLVKAIKTPSKVVCGASTSNPESVTVAFESECSVYM